jgi:signal transduction histidine kinase
VKSRSFKVKVGVYSTMLTVSAMLVGAVVFLVTLYFHQISALDDEMREDAEEMVWDLGKFRDGPATPASTLRESQIPLPLRKQHLLIKGTDGIIVYCSPGLPDGVLEIAPGSIRSGRIQNRLCRIGAWRIDPYVVHIGVRIDPIQRFMRQLGIGFLAALPAVALIVFIGGVWLARHTVAPLANLSEAAKRINAGHPEDRLPMPDTKDEIAALTQVLNHTFERLHSSYEAVARFSADASHQLKTPLAVLRASLDDLSKSTTLSTAQAAEVDAMRQQTRRLTSLIDDLLLLAQADTGRMIGDAQTVDLTELLLASADDLETLCTGRDIRVESRIPAELPVRADRRMVAIILQNLTENAAKYTSVGGHITITAEATAGHVFIRIRNTGTGVPTTERERIFDRFRRGGGIGGGIGGDIPGHGLGLSIARELSRLQGGDLVLLVTTDLETTFEFKLPASLLKIPSHSADGRCHSA